MTRRPELPTIWNSRTTLRDINDLKKKRDTGGKLDKTRRKDPKPRNHQDHFEDHSHSGGKKSNTTSPDTEEENPDHTKVPFPTQGYGTYTSFCLLKR